MNPIVLIASHERIDITTRNIESLLRQSIKPQIVISLSDNNEHEYFSDTFGTLINIIRTENNPLGKKWQDGVTEFCTYANPLIITGSDDILGDGFIKRACELVEQGNHFIGLQRFWQHHKGRAYLCDYLPHQPIGGGRIYSGEMLKKINYQVFDPTKDKHLDDLGFANVKLSGLKVKWIRDTEKEGLEVHAIKGDWPVMNPFTVKHKNLKLLRNEPSEKVLPSFVK